MLQIDTGYDKMPTATREELDYASDIFPPCYMTIFATTMCIAAVWLIMGCPIAAIASSRDTIIPRESTVTCNISVSACNTSACCDAYKLTWRRLQYSSTGCLTSADLNRTSIQCYRRGNRIRLFRIPAPTAQLRKVRIIAWSCALIPPALLMIIGIPATVWASFQSWGHLPWVVCMFTR